MERGELLVEEHTILAVVAGSRAFGLATAASDTDRRGVYVAPTEWFWRLEKPPQHWEGPLPEQFSLSLRGPGRLRSGHSHRSPMDLALVR